MLLKTLWRFKVKIKFKFLVICLSAILSTFSTITLADYGQISCAVKQDDKISVLSFSYVTAYDEAGNLDLSNTVIDPEAFTFLDTPDGRIYLAGDGLLLELNGSEINFGIFEAKPAEFACDEVDYSLLEQTIKAVDQTLENSDAGSELDDLKSALKETKEKLSTFQTRISTLTDRHAYIPDALIKPFRQSLHKDMLATLNKCWIEPEANYNDTLTLDITLGVLFSSPTFDSEGNISGSYGKNIRIFGIDERENPNPSLSLLNLESASEKAIKKCFTNYYIPNFFNDQYYTLKVRKGGFISIEGR